MELSNAALNNDLIEAAREFMADGRPADALRLLAVEMATIGGRTDLLAICADAWIDAVESGSALDNWSAEERDTLHDCLVTQYVSDKGSPIFHHRIAAQHSGGVSGHLGRAAGMLRTYLERRLMEPGPEINVVLLALLLRGEEIGLDQDRLSGLHLKCFPLFSPDDLRIPYSVVFDRSSFTRNQVDLARYVREHTSDLLGGRLPTTHLLLLHWLNPDAFSNLPIEWAVTAVASRRRSLDLSEQEEAAALSLALRFGFVDQAVHGSDAMRIGTALATTRSSLVQEANTQEAVAVSRLESRPRQLIAALSNEVRTRLPILARSPRRPRVALCISGQLRGFREAWPTWRPLLASIDVTIFVSSWRRVGRGTPEPFRSVLPFEGEQFCKAYKAVGASLGLNGLQERYPTLFKAFESSGYVDDEEVAALYGTPHVELRDESDAAYAGWSNSDKMYRQIQRCHDMLASTGGTFDVVVRIRPDKPIIAVAMNWPDLIKALRARPALYCETALGVHYGAILMGDQVAFGLPEASRVYAETATRAPPIAAVGPHLMEPHLWGHTSVAQLCWMNQLEVRKIPIKFGAFKEAEAFPARAIEDALSADANARMDALDRQLIGANRADLRR